MPASEEASIEFEVEPNYDGWVLRDYVHEKLKRPLPPGVLERALLDPSQTADMKVVPGMRIALRKRSSGDTGEPPPIPVIYEDEALLVVDKPAGLAIHPTARYHVTTLTWALSHRHLNAEGQKPDPAHRIDRETSGLVACGRTPRTTRSLKLAFQRREVTKSYTALVEGAPPQDRFDIDLPLLVGGGRVRVKVNVDPKGAASLTECTVVARYRDSEGKPLSLLRCVPRTGRQHQIRAHLLAAGFPLVGDKLYGPSEEIFLRLADSRGKPAAQGTFDALITEAERRLLRLPRQALHASALGFTHPETGLPMLLTAPLASDISTLLAGLLPG